MGSPLDYRRWSRKIVGLALFLVLAGGNVPARGQGEASHVHVLVVADTRGGNAKALGLDLDGKNVADTIRWAMNQQGLKEGPKGRYTITTLENQRVSEQAIFRYYRLLANKVKPTDTLVFYYTGHGGFYPDRGHRLNVRNYLNTGSYPAEVDRSDLLAAMGRHKPRALIVLTDCCASASSPTLRQETTYKVDSEIKKIPVLQGGGNGDVLRDLFFRSTGIINITAARTGTPARGNRKKGGSFFTIALCHLLKETAGTFNKNNGPVTWDKFFPFLEKYTEKESWIPVTKLNDGRMLGEAHTPEFFLLGKARAGVQAQAKVEKKAGPLPVKEEELTNTDPEAAIFGNTRSFYKEYRVQLSQKKVYLFHLHSPHFDTMLYIKDSKGAIVAANDDYGGTTRSRILFQPAETGDFVVGVTSFNSKETGRFTLTSHHASIVGELTRADGKDRFRKKSYFKTYPVHLEAGRSYTVRLESFDTRKLDPELRIEDEYGNTLAVNDDEDNSSRLNSVVAFRPLFSGTYYVVATSFAGGQTGLFALFLQD